MTGWLDKKYLMGESYGGYRGPRMTHYMQSQLGVAMNGRGAGVARISIRTFGENGNFSPVPWMMTLPSITAAHLESEHKLTGGDAAGVIAYTRGEYADDADQGQKRSGGDDAMIAKVTEMTGLDPQFVKYSGGRLETGAFLREVHREEGRDGKGV